MAQKLWDFRRRNYGTARRNCGILQLVINQTRLYSYFPPCGTHAFARLLGAWAREWRATGGVGVREGEGEGGSRCAP